MEYNDKHIDRFDAYLNQQMSSADKAGFESDLHADADLKQAFEIYQILVKGIQAKERSDLKAYLEANVPEMPHKPRWQVHKNVWSIAASIALIIGLFIVFQYSPKQPEKLAIQPASDELLTGLTDTTNQKANELNTSPSNRTLAEKPNNIPIIKESNEPSLDAYDDSPGNIELADKDAQEAPIQDASEMDSPRKDQYQSGTPKIWNLKDTQLSVLYVYDEADNYTLKRNKALSRKPTQARAEAKKADETVEIKDQKTLLEIVTLKVIKVEDEGEGYTFFSNNITLFQKQVNTYKLFNYQDKWYLSIGKNLYQIKNHCISKCMFETVSNAQIKDKLLNNK